jgi:small nuclear ribonucleoprotein
MLSEYLDTFVLVKLKDGTGIKGKLKTYDQHLNVVLSDAEEYKNGELKRRLGLTLVRGDSVVVISPAA